MSKKTRNWILAGIGLALFVLGVPLAEQVIATAGASENAKTPATCSQHEAGAAMGHPSVVKLGDNYIQFIAAGDASVGAVLYDSSFTMLGVNQNEATLTFALPDGVKKTVKISVPDAATLKKGASGDSCCPPSGTGPMPASCPLGAQGADQKQCPLPEKN